MQLLILLSSFLSESSMALIVLSMNMPRNQRVPSCEMLSKMASTFSLPSLPTLLLYTPNASLHPPKYPCLLAILLLKNPLARYPLASPVWNRAVTELHHALAEVSASRRQSPDELVSFVLVLRREQGRATRLKQRFG